MSNDQPAPVPNSNRPVWDLVIDDMRTRDRVGRERYGVSLQANNNHDPLRDFYEEALDLCVYLRQAIEERDAPPMIPLGDGVAVDYVKAVYEAMILRLACRSANPYPAPTKRHEDRPGWPAAAPTRLLDGNGKVAAA